MIKTWPITIIYNDKTVVRLLPHDKLYHADRAMGPLSMHILLRRPCTNMLTVCNQSFVVQPLRDLKIFSQGLLIHSFSGHKILKSDINSYISCHNCMPTTGSYGKTIDIYFRTKGNVHL